MLEKLITILAAWIMGVISLTRLQRRGLAHGD